MDGCVCVCMYAGMYACTHICKHAVCAMPMHAHLRVYVHVCVWSCGVIPSETMELGYEESRRRIVSNVSGSNSMAMGGSEIAAQGPPSPPS